MNPPLHGQIDFNQIALNFKLNRNRSFISVINQITL